MMATLNPFENFIIHQFRGVNLNDNIIFCILMSSYYLVQYRIFDFFRYLLS